MSPVIRLMFFPHRTYERLLDERPRVSWLAALERPALSAAIVGSSLAMWATNHVSVRLVLSLMVCWSLAIGLQLVAALALIVPARRQVTAATALDLLFAAHGPWSLWLLGSVVWVVLSSPIGRPAQFHLMTSLVPAVWTAVLVFVFCRAVLQCTRREALLRMALHQGIVWSVVLVLFALAVQLAPRIQAVLR